MNQIAGNSFASIQQMTEKITQSDQSAKKVSKRNETVSSFQEILNNAEQIKFSKHASERLMSRNIELTQTQQERLKDATVQAQQKGMKESLVLLDNYAFIVNVPDKTVVTAVNDVKNAVFTHIDGAIIN